MIILRFLLVFSCVFVSRANSDIFNYQNVKDEVYERPVNLMNPKKSPHVKSSEAEAKMEEEKLEWTPFDFSKFDSYVDTFGGRLEDVESHNRLKREPKRRRGGARRRLRLNTTAAPDDHKNASNTESVPVARRGRKKKKLKSRHPDTYEPPIRQIESSFAEMPKDLYQAHLRPGVIFRIHMSEAVLKMQYRNYAEDKDESVIEADVEYLRLTRKVISDEITKFEDLKWLVGWFSNRTELIQEHMCNTRYYLKGLPPTAFTHPEEYMKRMCLFDGLYVDHIPYVIGEDSSVMAAVAPPVLHCDAATCTSVPFIDSIMFEERLPLTNVRTVTRCQAACRARCRNDPECLKRCSDRCSAAS